MHSCTGRACDDGCACRALSQCAACLLPQVVTTLTWNKQDTMFYVPVWIIILAVLAGLLLLALLIYFLYKVANCRCSAE